MTKPITPSLQPGQPATPGHAQESPLCNLDRAIVGRMIEKMKIPDVTALFNTCRFTRSEYHEKPDVWMALFRSGYPNDPIPPELEAFKAYKHFHQYPYRLKQGIYTSIFLERESSVNHADDFYDKKIVDNARIYCASEEGIDIFDLNTGALLNTLPEVGGVESLTIVDQNLITNPCLSRTINTYHIPTGELLDSRQAPNDWATFIAIPGGRLLSYHFQDDPFIRIWNAQDLTLLNTLERPPGVVVSSMHFTRDELILGCQDGQLWVANLNTNQFKAFNGHYRAIDVLAVSGGKLFSSSIDSQVHIWNIATGVFLGFIDLSRKGGAASLAIEEGMLFVGGSPRSRIKIYLLETLKRLSTQEAIHRWKIGDQESANYLTFAGRKLVLEARRGMIQVRNYQAENAQVFREIAERFNDSTFEAVEEGLERFARMPQSQKDGIYAELRTILGMATDTPLQTVEDIFFDRSKEIIISNEQKVQAIENYLAKEGPL